MPIQKSVDPNSDPRKPKKLPGWYSWRHRTPEAQEAARQSYYDTHATFRARVARKQVAN